MQNGLVQTIFTAAFLASLTCSFGCSDSSPDAGNNPDAGGIDDSGVADAPGSTSAEWSSLGFDEHNTRHNPFELSIGPNNVADLKPKWIFLDVVTGVTSTPIVVDGVVYFGEWGSTVRALSAEDGTELWRAGTEPTFEVNSTPLVVGDRVYASAGHSVYAFDRADGRRLWSRQIDTDGTTFLWSSPRWVDGRIVIGVSSIGVGLPSPHTFRGSVVALDPDDGNELWRFVVAEPPSATGVSVWSSAGVDLERKLVFIGTGQSYEKPASPHSDALLAIDYESGALRWHHQYTPDDAFNFFDESGPDHDIGASPNLFTASNGRDLVGVGSKAGIYRAFDREDGEMVWEVRLGEGSALGGIMATSAVDGELVYINSNAGFSGASVTKAFRVDDGSQVWEQSLPSPTFGALAVANGVVYQPTTGGILHALDAKNGDVLWTVDLESDLGGGVSIVDGVLYAPRGFSFLTTRFENAGGLVAFSLDGQVPLDFSGGPSGGPDAGMATVDECLTATGQSVSAACRACACSCSPTSVAACDDNCWTLSSCVVSNCGTLDLSTAAGRQCVEDNCSDIKLLPQRIQDAVNGSAACFVQCQNECS